MNAGTVYVVDDDDAVRESLQALLESRGYVVSGQASAETFLASYRPGALACAVVDLRMPGMDGLTLIERLMAEGARLPVIMVTGHGDVPLAVRAMKAGATDFIEKPYSNEAILAAVSKAFGMAEQAAHGDVPPQETAARINALTPREREVLDLLVVGHSNKIIAFELKISPRTVEIHRANLMKKMQAGSLSHLVRMALAVGARDAR